MSRKWYSTGPRTVDQTGNTFGRWTVIENAGYKKNGGAVWKCKCSCGTERDIRAAALVSGESASCGCLQLEISTKHGHRNSPEYYVWRGIRSRCNNPRTPNYHRYGGRGISVAEEWNDFSNFLRDVGNRPGPDYSLDRINNDGNYEPGNVRWTTRVVQCRNTSCNRRLTFKGIEMTVSEWAEATGLGRTTIHYRIKAGWEVEKILTYKAPITFGAFFNDETKAS